MTTLVPFEVWFDVRDERHIAAYESALKTGEWPPGFIPEHVTCAEGWRVRLEARLIRDWIFLARLRIDELKATKGRGFNLTERDFEDL